MKFTILYKYCEEAKNIFERGNYGDGVNLVRLDKVDIINKKTSEFVDNAYAFRCTASIVDYFRHKALYGKLLTHLIGWKG